MFDIDLDTAKNLSVGLMGGSVLFLLLVLKFAKSVVTKLLLIVLAVGVGYLAFTQRDEVNACAEATKTLIAEGNAAELTCTFFGQQVSLPTFTTP